MHNTIIDKGFELHLTDVSIEFQRNNQRQAGGRPRNKTKTIRDILTTFFSNNLLSYNKEEN